MANAEIKTEGLTDPREARLAKLEAYKAAGKNPYAYNYPKTHDASQYLSNSCTIPALSLTFLFMCKRGASSGMAPLSTGGTTRSFR